MQGEIKLAAPELPESIKAEIKRYQDLIEKIRYVALNRQQLQIQLLEINNALKELSNIPDDTNVYKIVGTIMIAKPKKEVQSDLEQQKETLEIRFKSLQRQEELLRKQLNELEKKLTRKLGYVQGGKTSG